MTFGKRYLLKRILRTFPAFYAAVLIAFFGLIPMFQPEVSDPVYSLTVHFLFMQDYLGTELVPAFWSLGVEEKFYLVCPLALILLRKLPKQCRLFALVALALLPLGLRVAIVLQSPEQLISYPAYFWQVRAPFHLAMDGLWVGVMCALIYNTSEPEKKISRSVARAIFLLSSSVIIFCLFAAAWFDSQYFLASSIVVSIVSFAFGGLLLSVSCGPTPISRILRSRWLRVLAVLSYSLYLMHLMLLPLALKFVEAVVNPDSVHPLLHFFVLLPVFIGLSALAAVTLHYCVEKPFLMLKDQVRLPSSGDH